MLRNIAVYFRKINDIDSTIQDHNQEMKSKNYYAILDHVSLP